jgi:hypothetical protein
MILDGLLCEECGTLIDGDEPGYPRKCNLCAPLKRRHAEGRRIRRDQSLGQPAPQPTKEQKP